MGAGNAVDPDALRRRAEAVQARIAISKIVGADVALTKRGREWVGLCPFHNGTSLGNFTVNDAKGLYHCFACGANGDHIGYLRARKGLSFGEALRLLEADAGIDFRDAKAVAQLDRDRARRERAAADEAERKRRGAEGLWHHAAPLHASPGEAYLRGRAIDFGVIGKYPGAIRFRHDCPHGPTGQKMPAMLAAMVSIDGQHMATHRTFLARAADGWRKAPVEPNKMILGSFAGAHIPINKGACGPMPLRDVPPGTVVHISEGIEDALSVAMAHPDWRIVAAATLGNIGAVALPPQVRDVVVIGQHDRPGSAADNALERQIAAMQGRGLRVACLWPDPRYKDFNDQLRGLPMVTA